MPLSSHRRRVPLAEAERVLAEVRRRLVLFRGGRWRRPETAVVGSVRRGEPFSGDLDLLVVLPAGLRVGGALQSAALRAPAPGDTLAFGRDYLAGDRHRAVELVAPGGRYALDLFLATAAERPFALFHRTGDRVYNIRTRAYAKRQGWKLNQYGLFSIETGRRVRGTAALRTERDLARFLGVTYRTPAERVAGRAAARRPA